MEQVEMLNARPKGTQVDETNFLAPVRPSHDGPGDREARHSASLSKLGHDSPTREIRSLPMRNQRGDRKCPTARRLAWAVEEFPWFPGRLDPEAIETAEACQGGARMVLGSRRMSNRRGHACALGSGSPPWAPTLGGTSRPCPKLVRIEGKSRDRDHGNFALSRMRRSCECRHMTLQERPL
jgi:hypothetical protein